jgi:hypothetical protein
MIMYQPGGQNSHMHDLMRRAYEVEFSGELRLRNLMAVSDPNLKKKKKTLYKAATYAESIRRTAKEVQ